MWLWCVVCVVVIAVCVLCGVVSVWCVVSCVVRSMLYIYMYCLARQDLSSSVV